MSRVTLTIDRLALRGVDPSDAPALVEALKGELARVLAEAPLGKPSSRSVALARAAAPPLEPGRAGARKLGVAAARAIGREAGR
jgi:hypothetical protein